MIHLYNAGIMVHFIPNKIGTTLINRVMFTHFSFSWYKHRYIFLLINSKFQRKRMTQKTIKMFFACEGAISESEDETEDHTIENTIEYYQNLLLNKDAAADVAKVQTKNGSGSECWRFFGPLFVAEKKVLDKYRFCSICFKTNNKMLKGFKVTTSTTNHANHLKTVHNIELHSTNFKKTKANTAAALNSSKDKRSKFNHARQLAEMCCLDLQPFNIVERTGFQRYMKRIDGNLTFPTARTVGSTALNDVYNVYLDAIKNILERSPNQMNLVLDMWTDRYKKIAYINIKVHYCDQFQLKSISLKTEHFPHPHTGVTIGEKIDSALHQFKLTHKDFKAVTDGGTNIISALKMKQIERFPCLAHTLHRFIMHDVLEDTSTSEIKTIITKLKSVFRHLTYRSEDIQNIQQLKENEQVYVTIQKIHNSCALDENFIMGDLEDELEDAINYSEPQSLKNSVPTRWNSLLKMITSFQENVDVINLTLLNLKSENLIIHRLERKKLKELRQFLSIFEEATSVLQGQNYPTISSWIFFYENLYSKLEDAEMTASYPSTMSLYENAKSKFSTRFCVQRIHVLAALMDPCQKNWSALKKYLKKIPRSENITDSFILKRDVVNNITEVDIIYEAIQHYNLNCNSQSIVQSDEPPVKKEKLSGSRKKMLDFVASSKTKEQDSLKLEVEKYLDVDVAETESLDWWKENEKVFPRISKLANIYFGVPATSASSEMAFSAAGSCVTEKRSRLNPSTVKKQLFIHDNYKLIE
ncbi:E3 SUMO-protein ligase ZBED1-like [Haematobia irritans]|uniref:E3 SUMO-protein ligase ZBED1-like n=1 Tax=Haematobia irritans TaxID=7368 RepID=UPI003F50346C